MSPVNTPDTETHTPWLDMTNLKLVKMFAMLSHCVLPTPPQRTQFKIKDRSCQDKEVCANRTYHRPSEKSILVSQNEVQKEHSQGVNINIPMLVLTYQSSGIISTVCLVNWFQSKIPVITIQY